MAKRKAAADKEPASTSSPTLAGDSKPSSDTYTVLARRYRPQQFADIVGQEPVAQALVNALESNRVAHAYLFTGARGVGKTSTARILAKALNCVEGPTATPCGKCDICLGIASGEDVDVVEIDGASNRQIDDVREIRQNVQYRPSRARHKIYIIDEVHMLTKEAFNALLKTLEEPPPHVKFIFATTDVHKVPVTILSRCQRFDFGGISLARIVERLKQIVGTEGTKAEDEALELIARRAGGSMRDAQSLLDQLLAFGSGKLAADDVHRLLGTAADDRVIALASAIVQRDAKQVLELLDQAEKEGLQLGELLDQLIAYWRDLMVVHCAGADARDVSVSARHRDTLKQQATSQRLDTILAGLDILAATKNRLRGSSHARTWLEMALVRLARLDDLVSVAELAKSLGVITAESPNANPTQPAPAPAPARTRLSDLAAAAESRPLAPASTLVAPARSVSGPSSVSGSGNLPLTAQTLAEVWSSVLSQVGRMLAGVVEKAVLPAILGPNNLVIRFPLEYDLECKHFQDHGGLEKTVAVLRSITGQPWSLRVESSQQSIGSAPTPAVAETKDVAPPSTKQVLEEKALAAPLVKHVKELLNASFLKVDEGFGSLAAAASERSETNETEE